MSVAVDDAAELLPEVREAARIVALEWPGVIEADEAEQEILLRLLDRGYVDTVGELETLGRKRLLIKVGKQIAAQYRADYDRFSCNFRYSTGDVRYLLGAGALGGPCEVFDAGGLDVRESFKSLSDKYAAVLATRYLFNRPVSDTKAVTRAVDALTDLMNRNARTPPEHDGPGARKATSNAHAVAMTHRQF